MWWDNKFEVIWNVVWFKDNPNNKWKDSSIDSENKELNKTIDEIMEALDKINDDIDKKEKTKK